MPPSGNGSGESTLVIDRSIPTRVTSMIEVLFDGFGSDVELVTLAELNMNCGSTGVVISMVMTVEVAEGDTLPRSQVTLLPDSEQLP